MTNEQIEMLKDLRKNLTVAFNVQELSDCADELKDVLDSLRNTASENSEDIGLLEKADGAIFEVLCELEEYEIGGAFAAMVGNNSELRALYKENVQFSVGCIDEILKKYAKE